MNWVKAEIVAEIKANSDEQITVLAFGSRVMVALEAAEQFAQKHDGQCVCCKYALRKTA